MDFKLNEINRRRIKIRRGEQKHIPVNSEIKQRILDEALEGETQAETVDRVFRTTQQMTELLGIMVESMEKQSNNMNDLLNSLPDHLRKLFLALKGKKEEK